VTTKEYLKLFGMMLRHPLRSFGVLIVLACAEGMFGSPTGAQKLLGLALWFVVALIVAGMAACLWAIWNTFGPATAIAVVLGLIIGFGFRHLSGAGNA
jgi:cobalamin biosynthesis protein CobD/CbiB